MRTSIMFPSVLAALAVFAGPAAASPDSGARFGPPWISVEYPSNPHHPSTRGASFLIRTYHHTNAIESPVNAVAEGLVNGERRTLTLDVTRTSMPGVYAVNCDLPAQGTWIVAVRLGDETGSGATALVTMHAGGGPSAVEVPSRRTADGWVVPVEVTAADIEARLRGEARLGRAARGNGALRAGAAGLLALGLLVGLVRRRP